MDINIVSASGVTLKDANGKDYTDLISGISVSNVGHCHPKVVEAIRAQSEKYMHLMVYGEFNQSPQVNYATSVCRLLPDTLNSVYFTTGGSEAVEGAMKLAKRATDRYEIISFKNAYHGSTQGALSLMGDELFKNSFRPLLPGTKQIAFNSLDGIEEITTNTAAVFIEPIQGEAGIIRSGREFIKKLSERCQQTGTLLVFDEIQSGFGRTGTLFAFEQYGVVPDILLLAKGMGGGLPLGAFVASRELMSCLTNNPFLGHINTFGGNAVSVAAAQAALDVIVNEQLHLRAREIEQIIRTELKHPLIKDLRVCGALGAIDFGGEALNLGIIRACLEAGIITDWFLFCSTAMRIAPPLVISDGELITALRKVVTVINSIHH
jgi:acetylornithine/succinyldiaminopimelate/putrescine aminotransferase